MIRIVDRHKKFFIAHKSIVVCIVLILSTVAVYWQVIGHDFVNYDDDAYVYENRHVQKGLSLDNIFWAFTSTQASNWHPLTWISHLIDIQLYGMNPGRHHFTNLLLHIANTLLLFFVLKKLTGYFWQSWFVAALFALHPLHVESVAWVAERKDVLSTFFWMLTLWSYIRYVEHPGTNRYLLVLAVFTLGLMSKPMIVTLPFVLLLLDFYPLSRIRFQHIAGRAPSCNWSIVLRLAIEKLPFFVLVAMSSVVTIYAQKLSGAMISLDRIPFALRIANALVSYVKYIWKMIYPAKLAVLYPYQKTLPGWEITAASIILVTLSVLAIRVIKTRPYVALGWFWYLGTLVPVIGLVQVGSQSMADRYTYIPLIGLFMIIAWGIPDLLGQWRHKKNFLTTTVILLLLILMAVTWKQLGHWKNSITLFEHAIHFTSNKSSPRYNLGLALHKKGRINDAIKHYQQALRINPNHENAHNNLGLAFLTEGRIDDALRHLRQALRIKPDNEDVHYNLGLALDKKGRIDDAIKHYQQVLRICPNHENARNNLGLAFYTNGDKDRAIAHFRKVIETNPQDATARHNLKQILMLQK